MLVTVTDYARLSCEQAVPIEELDRVLAAAERDIHAITYERSAGVLTEYQLCIVQQCIVDQADFRFKYAAMLDNPLASYGINGVSMSWDTNKVSCRNGVYTSTRIEAQLLRSGLLYQGVF